jgi:uncharacterized protein (TIGR02466 family)
MTRIEFIQRKPTLGLASQVNLFPAPLLVFRWPEAETRRDAVLSAIGQRRARYPGIRVSNRGGWHSQTDLTRWGDDATTALMRWAAAMASKATASWRGGNDAGAPAMWRVMAWANANPPGGAHNRSHHHVNRNWNWSACYYVRVPSFADDATRRGEIVFDDRNVGLDGDGSANAGRRSFAYEPSEGELVLFPAWLYHRVEPHEGDGDRITIAMNFHSPWLERSRYWQYRKGWAWRRLPWAMRPLAWLAGSWDQSDPGGPPGDDIWPDPAYL